MKNFCLPIEQTQRFLRGIKSGEINPDVLMDMTSQQRREFFTSIVGEDAQRVNALFESKLLLKNQKQGMINWVKTVGGLNPAKTKSLIQKIQKLDTVLDANNEQSFLQDLASTKLGTEVTFDEAKKITELSNKIESLSTKTKTYQDRIKYGEAIMDMYDYVETLNPVRKHLIENVLNAPKTAMSTLDFSAPLRQGWGMMSRKEYYKAFGKMFQYAFSPKAFRELQADIITRPTYDMMKKGGLRISSLAEKLSQREEDFMSNLLSKIPGVGASERAYVGFLNKLRADTFDNLVNAARVTGENVELDSPVLKEIASVVNDFTGSGNIGKYDKYANVVPTLNSVFFSPRKISATMNMFNPQRYVDPRISPTARKAALRQLIGSSIMSATILGLASMAGADITTNPTNPDFGKIKVGNTRFDVTGGNGNFAVLLSKLIANKSTSSTSGKVTQFGEGYKPTTRLSTIARFGRNKLSPIASYIVDALEGSNAIGEEFKIAQDARDRFVPLVIQGVIELYQDDPSMAVAGALASIFGVGVQTY